MKIGLIDVDGHNFPNLALMKISAWHKSQGDDAEWWVGNLWKYDLVYMSKVFDNTYSPDVEEPTNCIEVIKGGTGYGLDNKLPEEEKIFDYMGRNITNEILITCSRAICNECAIEYKDLDFCPHCVKKMKKIFESDIAKKSMQRNILKKQRRKENDKIIRTRKR
ncbi:MAG: hypothetical protein RR420_05340 [Anaerovoracaceae bacterium]